MRLIALRAVARPVSCALVVERVWPALVEWDDVVDDERSGVEVREVVVDGFAADPAGWLVAADDSAVSIAYRCVASHVSPSRAGDHRAMKRALLALSLLAGCSSQPSPTSPATVTVQATSVQSTSGAPTIAPSAAQSPTSSVRDATAIGDAIRQKVASVTKVVTITEDNDPNHKIGRPGGYVSAAVLYDSGAKCTGLGVGCGATVEVWPTEGDARARADYVQAALRANPILGTEYGFVSGPVLLRVSGAIKPSVAKNYEAGLR
jgi:hypothetical protein